MKVALGQTIGTAGDVAANLALMQRLAQDAASRGADLLLLPELFLTGYNIGTAIPDLAEPLDGPSAKAVAAIAKAAGLAIAYGYPERTAEGLYNAGLIFDRRLGFMICYDIDFPEVARSIALAGVDAIIALSATSKPYHVVPRHLIPARAYENRLFFAFLNRAGQENGLSYAGESCIAAPDGEVIAQCGDGEELVIGTLDVDAYATFRHDHQYKSDRRPHLYRL
jgi:predicted amidohydrolase